MKISQPRHITINKVSKCDKDIIPWFNLKLQFVSILFTEQNENNNQNINEISMKLISKISQQDLELQLLFKYLRVTKTSIWQP